MAEEQCHTHTPPHLITRNTSSNKNLPAPSFQSPFKEHLSEIPIQPVPVSLRNASYATFDLSVSLSFLPRKPLSLISYPKFSINLSSCIQFYFFYAPHLWGGVGVGCSCLTVSQFVTPHKHTAKFSFMRRPLTFRSPGPGSINPATKTNTSPGMLKRWL